MTVGSQGGLGRNIVIAWSIVERRPCVLGGAEDTYLHVPTVLTGGDG